MKFDMVLPLLGFENIQKVQLEKVDNIFMKMESVEDKNISFTMIDPFVLRTYDFEIPDKTKELLQIDENSNLLILNVLLIQNPIENSIINFLAPLVFNTDSKKAAQVIISNNIEYEQMERIESYLKK